MAWQIRQLADFWRAEIDTLAEGIGGLWVEKLTLDLTPPSKVATDSAVAEVHQLMSDISIEPGFLEGMGKELEQILSLLPAERRREIAPDEAAQATLLRHLSEDAVLSMVAKMRGQGA